MKKQKIAVASVGALLVAIVIIQNTVPVTIRFLLLEVTLPNAVLMGLVWLMGLATGLILALNYCGKTKPVVPGKGRGSGQGMEGG